MFRGFSEGVGRGGRLEFKFSWLTKRPLEASFDAGTETLTFHGLLTGLPARSVPFLDLKRFLASLSTRAVPAHRGVDPARAEIRVINRDGAVSLGVRAKPGHASYGVNRAVNVVHELFLWLQESHADYMWDAFEAPHE